MSKELDMRRTASFLGNETYRFHAYTGNNGLADYVGFSLEIIEHYEVFPSQTYSGYIFNSADPETLIENAFNFFRNIEVRTRTEAVEEFRRIYSMMENNEF